jgi:hypothetical protein
MIENAKAGGIWRLPHPTGRRVPRPVPRQLAPRRVRRSGGDNIGDSPAGQRVNR